MTEPAPPATSDFYKGRYPDFLCIGAQKSGTTWLDTNLRSHPAIWLPPIKELQYFNDLYLPWQRSWTGAHRRSQGMRALHGYLDNTRRENWDYRYIARLAEMIGGDLCDHWYGQIFTLAGKDQICGEVTPEYSLLPREGIRHVLRLAPNARIVLMLRDPVDRNWSHIRMTAPKNATMEDYLRIARYGDVVVRADYPKIIATWSQFVPPERFKVLFMDEVIARPGAVMEDVCAFMGVDYDEKFFPRLDTPVHVGEAREIPTEVHDLITSQLLPIYDRLCEMYPDVGAKWRSLHY